MLLGNCSLVGREIRPVRAAILRGTRSVPASRRHPDNYFDLQQFQPAAVDGGRLRLPSSPSLSSDAAEELSADV
jgi:hypothetical protein